MHNGFYCVVAISIAISGCTTNTINDFNNSATLNNADKYMAFVGEKIQFVQYDPSEDYPEPAEDDDIIIINMDAAFKRAIEYWS